jgi:glucose-6-phosphate isomerase
MSTTKLTGIFQTLAEAAQEHKQRPITALFDLEAARIQQFTQSAGPLTLDFSKQNLSQNALSALIALAEEKQVMAKANAMFNGDAINHTEQRAVLHTALRNTQHLAPYQADTATEIEQTKARMLNFVDKVISGELCGANGDKFTDVVSIGIGGSFFGPKMLEAALVDHKVSNIKVHYLANIDGAQIRQTLSQLNPARTLIVVASKSWTTAETQLNASAVLDWFNSQLGQSAISKHWVALTAKPELAGELGISQEYTFPLWDFVGGRYSVWSVIGLPLALSIGSDNFNTLLAGAAELDQHFLSAEPANNLPLLAALIGYWQQAYFDVNNLMVLPYSHALKTLPAYLQQLDMESNGKSVNLAGEAIELSGPILWGAEGTNCQHSFMQLIHQGKQSAMVDFILPKRGDSTYSEHHNSMVANCLAQAQALLQGKTQAQAFNELLASGLAEDQANALAKHKAMPGNTGSNTLLLDDLSPRTLGALLAFYEHKVFVQGVLFGINSYDQWGVELGKQLGNGVLKAIKTNDHSQLDASTQNLLAMIYG